MNNEIWKSIPKTNNAIEISNHGNVRYVITKKPLHINGNCIQYCNESQRHFINVRLALNQLFNITHFCKFCGNTNPDNFTGRTNKWCDICKPNYNKCEICGETNSKAFYPHKPHKCKKCLSLQNKAKYIKLPKKEKKTLTKIAKNWHDTNLIRRTINSTKYRANKKKWQHNLTEQQLLELYKQQNGQCYYSGLPIQLNAINTQPRYVASLDRIDSTKGYTIDNVVWTSQLVNIMKSTLSVNEFYDIIQILYNHKQKAKF